MANCLTALRAIARLHNQTAAGTEFDSKKQLVSVSTARLVFFGIAQSFRFTLAVALCYGGSYFIAHTIALGDLILNCVALEVRRISRRKWRPTLIISSSPAESAALLCCQFVMEIDELLFDAYAPKKLKDALRKAAKLEMPSLRRFHGMDLSPVLKLSATLVMIGVMIFTGIAPQTRFLIDAGAAMCGTPGRPCFSRALLVPHVWPVVQAAR